MGDLNPAQTMIRLPDEIEWLAPPDAPPRSVEMATLAGSEHADGIYLVLMKWYPGYMSAPHHYRTDRLCVVVSGIWWCNSGPDFDPARAVAAYANSYVRRVAGTPHVNEESPIRLAEVRSQVDSDLPLVVPFEVHALDLVPGRGGKRHQPGAVLPSPWPKVVRRILGVRRVVSANPVGLARVRARLCRAVAQVADRDHGVQ